RPGLIPGAWPARRPSAGLRIGAGTPYRQRELSRIIEARRRVVLGPEAEQRDGVAIEEARGQSELAGHAQEATDVADPRRGGAELKERLRVKRQPQVDAAEDFPNRRADRGRLVARRRREKPVGDVGVEGSRVVAPDVHAALARHLL